MTAPSPLREPQVLQAYQRRLNDALADTTTSTDAVIALEMGDQGWLVSLKDLAETSLCPALAKTGSMPSGVMGVGNFRGRVNTVVSMPVLLAVPDDFRGQGWTTVLHSRLDVALALWWPRMLGLFSRSDFSRAHPNTPLLPASRAAWENGDGRVWQELDTERVLREKFGVGEMAGEANGQDSR